MSYLAFSHLRHEHNTHARLLRSHPLPPLSSHKQRQQQRRWCLRADEAKVACPTSSAANRLRWESHFHRFCVLKLILCQAKLSLSSSSCTTKTNSYLSRQRNFIIFNNYVTYLSTWNSKHKHGGGESEWQLFTSSKSGGIFFKFFSGEREIIWTRNIKKMKRFE